MEVQAREDELDLDQGAVAGLGCGAMVGMGRGAVVGLGREAESCGAIADLGCGAMGRGAVVDLAMEQWQAWVMEQRVMGQRWIWKLRICWKLLEKNSRGNLSGHDVRGLWCGSHDVMRLWHGSHVGIILTFRIKL